MQIIAIIISIGLLYFVQSFIYGNIWSKNLTAELHFNKNRVTEGETVILEEKIENRKWLPLPFLYLKFHFSRNLQEIGAEKGQALDRYNRNELFSILMRQRIIRSIPFDCSARGVYRVEGFQLTASNLFLNDEYIKELTCEEKLIVYPAGVDIGRFWNLFRDVYGEVATRRFVQENPFLYRGVREYQSYDSMRRIDWGSTAKTGEMKVHVQEHTSQHEISIYLNLQKETMIVHQEVLEESIRLAKSFCTGFTKQGIKNVLYTNGYDGETDEMIKVQEVPEGRNYLELVNEGLAKIKLSDENRINAQQAEWSNNFLRVYQEQIEKEAGKGHLIFISNYQGEDFQRMLQNICRKTEDFHWIIPVSTSMDYHPQPQLRKYTRMWRLNWEGMRREAAEK